MQRLGLSFESVNADVDESRIVGESPADMATRLAILKASTVAQMHPDAWVVGADQVIAIGDRILSKPGTAERAVEQLVSLEGRDHRLISAVAVVSPNGVVSDSCPFEMSMRRLSRETIEAYVAEDDPLDCAGSYKVELAGIRLFSKMRGDDYTSIVGLPLTTVWALLEQSGYFEAQG